MMKAGRFAPGEPVDETYWQLIESEVSDLGARAIEVDEDALDDDWSSMDLELEDFARGGK